MLDDVSHAVLSTIESSYLVELGSDITQVFNVNRNLTFSKLIFSPELDPSNVNTNANRQPYEHPYIPGLGQPEPRLMDHNDLFVLDFGKIRFPSG